MIGAAEIGQGSETTLLQVAAEALGLDLADLTMAPCDSSIAPVDLGSYSSRVTLMGAGEVLFESVLFDDQGNILNPNRTTT